MLKIGSFDRWIKKPKKSLGESVALHTDVSISLNKVNETIMNSTQQLNRIKFSKGEFEISGDPDFVKEQIENFKPSIESCLNSLAQGFSQNSQDFTLPEQKLLTTIAPQLVNPVKSFAAPRMEDAEFIEVSSINYENVLVIENGKVQVIADMPGESVAKRMVNFIIVYLWGKLQQNIEEVSSADLREACEKYGEMDKANFSKHINTHKKYFLIEGSGRNQSVRLIRPGIKEALRLINDLNRNS